MNRRRSVVLFPIWCLLSFWLFFGSLELAESSQWLEEPIAEDQADQDLDQEALKQLALGLKPDVPSLAILSCASGPDLLTGLVLVSSPRTVVLHPGWLGVHIVASRRLHQWLSVYRI